MQIITIDEFSQNMDSYLDYVIFGEDVVLKDGDAYYKVVHIDKNALPDMSQNIQNRIINVREQLQINKTPEQK